MISFCDFVEKVRGKKWKEFFDISVCINYELEDLSRNTCNNHIIVADEILKSGPMKERPEFYCI